MADIKEDVTMGAKQNKKLPVLIVIILIVLVLAVSFIYERLHADTPTDKMADLNDIYQSEDGTAAVIANGVLSEARAEWRGQTAYLNLGIVRDELNEVERHELRVRRVGHHGRAVLGLRQDDHVVGHEHIEDERVHDERAQPGDGAELAVLVDHVGQRDGEGDQREGQKAGHDVAGVDAHGTGSPRGRGRNGRAGRACAAHVTIIGDGARAAARAIASTLRLRRL